MNDFKSGDVVSLISGSPKMTVSDISDNNCNCVWFDGNNVKYGQFSKSILIKN